MASADTVTFNGLSSDNGNYTITAPTQAATITPKPLTATGTLSVPATRAYDGTISAALSGAPALLASIAAPGVIGDGKPITGDTVNIIGGVTASYNSKNVASADTVTFNGLSSDNGNYTITAPRT